jgi:hypothetical protein
MAITTVTVSSKAQLVLDGGTVDGKEKKIKKSLSNLKPAASNDAVHATCQSIGGLQEKSVLEIHRIDEVELIEA